MKKLFVFFCLLLVCCHFVFGQITQQQIDAYKGTATGTDTYSVTISAITAMSPYDGQKIWVKFSNANTGASTLKVNSYTARAITLNGSAVTSGQIVANQYVGLVYYLAGTSWQIQSPQDASSATGWSLTGNAGTTMSNFVGTTDNKSLRFRTNNVPRVIFDSLGNAGFGISIPTAKLHVVGTSTVTPIFQADSGSTVMFKIHPRGQIHAGNGLGNLFIGYNSGMNYTTGDNNVGVGVYALASIKTGNDNSAFGERALYSDTSGSSNSAFGMNALTTHLSGSSNSAFGVNALRLSTTGYDNTAIGVYSLENLTSGYQNVAIGVYSLGSNIGGGDNTAMGRASLYGNISGTGNVGVGLNAGRTNSVGTNNTHIGSYAGYTETGSNNLFIGYRSGYYQGAVSGKIYVGTYDYINSTLENSRSPIVIQSHETDSSQTILRFNGVLNIQASTGVDSTAGDAVVINKSAGRFAKDISGSTFTLTNSFITFKSVILLTFASDPGGTANEAFKVYVTVSNGSAVITFKAVPTSTAYVNFFVIN